MTSSASPPRPRMTDRQHPVIAAPGPGRRPGPAPRGGPVRPPVRAARHPRLHRREPARPAPHGHVRRQRGHDDRRDARLVRPRRRGHGDRAGRHRAGRALDRPARRPARAGPDRRPGHADRGPRLPLPDRVRPYEAPAWTLFASYAATATTPNIGGMSRARWTHLLRGAPAAPHTAKSFEQAADELCFMLGPVLAAFLCSAVFPEAGTLAGAALFLTGMLVFTAQRATEPPAGAAARPARRPLRAARPAAARPLPRPGPGVRLDGGRLPRLPRRARPGGRRPGPRPPGGGLLRGRPALRHPAAPPARGPACRPGRAHGPALRPRRPPAPSPPSPPPCCSPAWPPPRPWSPAWPRSRPVPPRGASTRA